MPKLAFLVPAALLLLPLGPRPARADLFTTVTPTVSLLAGGDFSYSYLVANSSASTVGVSEFDLSVLGGTTLSGLTAPTGFLALYTAGDPDVQFLSTDPSMDIAPGAGGVFSFTANAGPSSAPDLLRGLDGTSAAVFQNAGFMLTPSAVPEPSVLVLAALGALAVFGPRAGRRLLNSNG